MVISTSDVRIEVVNIHSLIFLWGQSTAYLQGSTDSLLLVGSAGGIYRELPQKILSRGYGTSEFKNGLLEM